MFVEILHKEKKLNTFELNINKYLPNSYNLICIFIFVFLSEIYIWQHCKIIKSEVLSLCLCCGPLGRPRRRWVDNIRMFSRRWDVSM